MMHSINRTYSILTIKKLLQGIHRTGHKAIEICQVVLALCKQSMENQEEGKKERRREEKEKKIEPA
jgi:hypothetical protein